MKTRKLIWFVLCIQVVFLVYWLFSCPEVHSELKVARDELQRGDADPPALTVRHSDSTETTVAYDRSKSTSENLLARAVLRLSIAEEGYRFLIGVSVVVSFLNLILLIVFLVSSRGRPNQTLQATAATPSS
jgi:hypothetical protein